MMTVLRGDVVILVKAPIMGRVKTRLAHGVGAFEAARLYRAMTRETLRQLGSGPWRLWLAVDPPSALRAGFWPKALRCVPQDKGDLGRRLAGLFRRFARQPMVLIGSDCPAVTTGDIHAAFNALRRKNAVMGPAEDGGYWLLGLKGAPPPGLFAGVRWSSRHAYGDTAARLRRPPARLRRLRDIDTAADLAVVLGRSQAPLRCSVKRGINSTRLHGRNRLSS